MRLSIFSTVFIVFLIVISPLYIIGILINNAGQNRARMEIYSSTLNTIDFYVSNVEQEIKKLVDTEVVLINNTDIQDISALYDIPYDYGVYKKIENISKELSILSGSSRYVQQVYMLFPVSGLKITELGRQTMTEFDYQCVSDTDFISGFLINNHSSGTYINFTSEFHRQHPPVQKITYIIAAKIDTERISMEVNDYFSDGSNQICFWGSNNGLNISNGINEKVLTELKKIITAMPSLPEMFIDKLHISSINKDVFIAYRHSSYLRSSFIMFGEEERFFSSLQTYSHWIWILTCTMIVLLVVFTIWTHNILHVPVNKLIATINRGIAGDLNNTVEYRSNEEFMYIYRRFNEMLTVQRAAINQAYESDLLVKDVQLKMLQYQINPHFMYNCFFLMYQMLQASEYDTVKEMLLRMGNYFSFVTKSESLITLESEMKFCKDYIEIQTIRFSGRITVTIEDMPKELKEATVPRIIIQPILENCYKHGLANKESDGLIELRFNISQGVITIEDNGEELSEERLMRLNEMLLAEKPEVISGLWNVNRRLKAHFGEEYGLTARRGIYGGLLMEMFLPVNAGVKKCTNC